MPTCNSIYVTATAMGCLLIADTQCAEHPRKPTELVKVAARVSQPDALAIQVLSINITIAKDCYVFANPVENELLTGSQLRVFISGISSDRFSVTYPKGQTKSLEVTGDFKIYEGDIKIAVVLQRSEMKTAPVEIELWCQPVPPMGRSPLPMVFKYRVHYCLGRVFLAD